MAKRKERSVGTGILPGFEEFYQAGYPDTQKDKVAVIPKTRHEKQSVFANILAKSALYTPVNITKRKIFANERLYSPEGTEVIYTGEQLNAADQDLALVITRELKGGPITAVSHPVSAWLELCGRARTKTAYDWFHRAVLRSNKAHLYIKGYGFRAGFTIISAFGYIKDSDLFGIELSRFSIAALHSGHSYIDMEKRALLKSDMARCLQCHICSDEKGVVHQTTLEELQLLMNSQVRTDKFRVHLKKALDELESCREIRDAKVTKTHAEWVRPKHPAPYFLLGAGREGGQD